MKKRSQQSSPEEYTIGKSFIYGKPSSFELKIAHSTLSLTSFETHCRWGVGTTSDSGGTGVLIFLSVDDRVVYISRGGSFDTLLRDSRIDSAIKELRPR
jgi:hypothetical protein